MLSHAIMQDFQSRTSQAPVWLGGTGEDLNLHLRTFCRAPFYFTPPAHLLHSLNDTTVTLIFPIKDSVGRDRALNKNRLLLGKVRRIMTAVNS